MGTVSSSTASPTVARKNETGHIAFRTTKTVASRGYKMALAYNSQIHQDDTLMNLQELDSHLTLFEATADISADTVATSPSTEFNTLLDVPQNSSLKLKMDEINANTVESLAMPQSMVTNEQSSSMEPNSTSVDDRVSKSAHHLRPLMSELVRVKTENMGSSIASLLTDRSELSSALSTASSKGTSPAEFQTSRETTQLSSQPAKSDIAPRVSLDVKARSSIPAHLELSEYTEQCISAAESCRLNPYALHANEYALFRNHLNRSQVTAYLNMRNAILRLWVRNPQIAVSRVEAIGCAKESRWFDAANVCYEWLFRNGYINFGCFEIIRNPSVKPRTLTGKRLRIVVIGAGVAGLTCARQLENLFTQNEAFFHEKGQPLPEVVVLEGRDRIGGRVYSRQLKTKPSQPSDLNNGSRCTAEMGGMIVVGFERGNPLNILIRNQLALPYYALVPDLTLYDINGQPVNDLRDKLNESLHNYALERVSKYKFKVPPVRPVEGNKELINAGRDISNDVGPVMSQVEGSMDLVNTDSNVPSTAIAIENGKSGPASGGLSASSDRFTGRPHIGPVPSETLTAAQWARSNGWPLKVGVEEVADINLDTAAAAKGATLGSVLDETINQLKSLAHVLPLDLRLQGWHAANLEYANAQSLRNLSLSGWDADAGNEWEGVHTMVKGGYQQVPRGLMNCPSKLDVRKSAAVTGIKWDEAQSPVEIQLEKGEPVVADHVVCTVPLGVLKANAIKFDPPLPDWKISVIERMGFGVLNKVILVFREKFWDQDFFGILRDPVNRASLDMKDYALKRGRFFQFVNCTETSGLPVLVALMAGDTAVDLEREADHTLISEAAAILRNVFGRKMSDPVEAIVTRWGNDRFARGSYSSAGPNLKLDDYDQMAKRVSDTLFFAGEHTSATHPATVHGAILSGLRAASELYETIVGPIPVPEPLLPPRESKNNKRKASELELNPRARRLAAYEEEVIKAMIQKLGPWPELPQKRMTALQMYTKEHYEVTKQRMEETKRGRKKLSPNEVRGAIGNVWKALADAEKQPYVERAGILKREYEDKLNEFKTKAAKYEEQARAFREEYAVDHPSVPGPEEEQEEDDTPSPSRRDRKVRRVESYAE